MNDDRIDAYETLHIFGNKTTEYDSNFGHLEIRYQTGMWNRAITEFTIYDRKYRFSRIDISYGYINTFTVAGQKNHEHLNWILWRNRPSWCMLDYCNNKWRGLCKNCLKSYCYKHVKKATAICMDCRYLMKKG
ncbi:MAG: hypothetical protein ACXAC2_00415 [Candidatus Kariarchaeaceae archaeon]|jgi:hypothetical protein